jgi:hypothetical protein
VRCLTTRKTEIFIGFIISVGFLKKQRKNSNFRRPKLADGRTPNFRRLQSQPTKELVLSYSRVVPAPTHNAHTLVLLSPDLVGLMQCTTSCGGREQPAAGGTASRRDLEKDGSGSEATWCPRPCILGLLPSMTCSGDCRRATRI